MESVIIKNKFGTTVSYEKVSDKRFKKGYRVQESGRSGIGLSFAEMTETSPRYLKDFPK